MPRYVEIVGWGKCLPEQVIDNKAICERYKGPEDKRSTPEEIYQVTGIRNRRFAPKGIGPENLGASAGSDALAVAGIPAKKVEQIILATESGQNFPTVASKVQAIIGAENASITEIHNACSGSLDAFRTAYAMVRSGEVMNALVVATDTFSLAIDWKDWRIYSLFGDGAGAIFLQGREETTLDRVRKPEKMIFTMHSDGRIGHVLQMLNSGLTDEEARPKPIIFMPNGRQVYYFGVSRMREAFLKLANIKGHYPKWFVPHQANGRMTQEIIEKLGFAPFNTYSEGVRDYGNTGPAGLLIGLAEMADGYHPGKKFKRGDWVLLTTAGANVTWGAAMFRWPGERWFRPRLFW